MKEIIFSLIGSFLDVLFSTIFYYKTNKKSIDITKKNEGSKTLKKYLFLVIFMVINIIFSNYIFISVLNKNSALNIIFFINVFILTLVYYDVIAIIYFIVFQIIYMFIIELPFAVVFGVHEKTFIFVSIIKFFTVVTIGYENKSIVLDLGFAKVTKKALFSLLIILIFTSYYVSVNIKYIL